MTGPSIEAEGLAKHYGEVTALDDLTLDVPRGELFGFLGPNGAGKSTTINILTGQLVPDAGTARVAGVDPVEHPVKAREKVGILPENGRPPSFLTVREYFDFVAAARELDEIEGRVERWAERLAFESKLDTLCTDLSQGERQKVLITQAFLHEPEVVFIDEPLTNLDPIIQERAKRFFRSYAADDNTVFLSTHFIPVAQEMCTRVAIINRGRLLTELDPRDIDEGTLLDRFFETVDSDTAEAVATDPAMPGATAAETDGGEESADAAPERRRAAEQSDGSEPTGGSRAEDAPDR